jgi:hypothetical protein
LNDYGQIAPCRLCGLPKDKNLGEYHRDCGQAHRNLVTKMKLRHSGGDQSEVCDAFQVIVDSMNWLLRQPSRDVRDAVGQDGEDFLIDMNVRMEWLRCL